MDTIGPLPTADNGDCYILVVIDTFTRWIELFPIKSTTAAETAQKLIQHFGRFGQAQELQSDNGTQFVNEIIRELCLIMGSEQKRTLAYSSEENGIVERANKEVLRHLRALVYDSKVVDKWNIYLPFVQRILNSAVSQNTGVSPAQLLFGNAITLNRSILVDLPIHVKQDLSQWANDMVEAQYLLIDRAATQQRAIDAKNCKKRQREDPTEFPDGSLVLVQYHKKGFKKGPPNKVLTNLKGPYQVIAHELNAYELRDLGSEKIETHHVTDLRPFKYDPEHTDPAEVALTDKQLFVVDAITAHEGDPRRKSSMTFTVKWKGYEGHPDEFTPNQLYKDLKNNVSFHEYCRKNKELLCLIPTQFRS
jgi:transposase InsO family protein